MSAPEPMSSPLARAASLKVKLGALVGVSVLVATVLATIGARSAVTPWLVVPVTVALALGVTQWLASGMTAPLRAMTSAAGAMARGDYSARIVASGRDEVADLAQAFTSMAQELRDADQHRRDLIATVSHELRTPAAALRALVENMADGITPADSQHLGAALGQAERLGDLLTDLLALSRLDAGLSELRLEPVLVADLLTGVAAELTASGRTISTDISVTPSGLTVAAEAPRLRQAVTNLLDNAVRHTPPGTSIALHARALSDEWQLDVIDAGPGIAVADRERIFERFGTAAAGGTGLGLAITRWVAVLHGGSVAAIDPEAGRPGARLRLTLPLQPPSRPRAQAQALSGPQVPPPAAASVAPCAPASPAVAARRPSPRVSDRTTPPPVLDGLFGSLWPESASSGRPRLVLLAAVVGALAAALLPERDIGLAWSLVLLACGASIVLSSANRTWITWTAVALGAGLASLATLRAAGWLVPLSILAGGLLIVVAIVPVGTVSSLLGAALAWPLAGLRGLPWLGRSLTIQGRALRWWAAARTLVISALALLVFGALFASADAIFGHWVDLLVPDVTIDGLVARAFVGTAVFGVTLAGIYLAINPIRAELLAVPTGRPVAKTWEWLIPVGFVIGAYALFIAAQASAWLGGHDYVQQQTGLSYAEYVHQGFGQLSVATVLTLAVVALAARKAGRADPGDRLVLRVALGTLCLLTLAVVASALWRMHLYQQAFGYTTLRLLVDAFEFWVALVLVMVLIAGISLTGRWIPRAAIVAGAGLVLALGLMNPEAWVAQRNLERWQESGTVDLHHLGALSADAVPVIAASGLPATQLRCVLAQRNAGVPVGDGVAEWNLGRARARAALQSLALTTSDGACNLDAFGDANR